MILPKSVVDHRGIEPLTSRLRTWRSPESRAYAPQKFSQNSIRTFDFSSILIYTDYIKQTEVMQ